MNNVVDRIPTEVLDNGAVRWEQFDAQGNSLGYVYMKKADEPIEEGTKLNKVLFDSIKDDFDKQLVNIINEQVTTSINATNIEFKENTDYLIFCGNPTTRTQGSSTTDKNGLYLKINDNQIFVFSNELGGMAFLLLRIMNNTSENTYYLEATGSGCAYYNVSTANNKDIRFIKKINTLPSSVEIGTSLNNGLLTGAYLRVIEKRALNGGA